MKINYTPLSYATVVELLSTNKPTVNVNLQAFFCMFFGPYALIYREYTRNISKQDFAVLYEG